VRIALVSPYSWTYPGGVNRHIQSLAEEFISQGHFVRVIAPFDPPGRLSKAMHRAAADPIEAPDYLIPVGRTLGIGANGSVSNVSVFPEGVRATRRTIEEGNFDVVHLHEPMTPVNGWDTGLSCGVPVVGTFHAYSTRPIPNRLGFVFGARRVLNGLSARIAVSEAAAWTGRRWFGGNYSIVPNGVNTENAPEGPKPVSDHLRILFIGRSEERKGLPVLLKAFDALVDHVPSRLSIVGADAEEVRSLLPHPETEQYLDLHGRVDDQELWRHLHDADVLCAPSLAGESFGMVLTEAFAAGTPVIASEIAGYSDVVTDGVDGVLVPPADPQRLAEELQRAWLEPERIRQMGENARESSKRYAWDSVARQVSEVYERAMEVPAPETEGIAWKRRLRFSAKDALPGVRPRRLPSLDPSPITAAAKRRGYLRKGILALASIFGVGMTVIAANKIGMDSVGNAIVRSDVSWILIAVALMATSMFARALAWYFIAKAAMPGAPLRKRDFASATMIGVLMSATLPARLGEPARALALARHTGQTKETLPVVAGTIVSQTLLNLMSLLLLGLIIVSSTDLFHNSTKTLFTISLLPVALLLIVIVLPPILKRQGNSRMAKIGSAMHDALIQVRQGLAVFKKPRSGVPATFLQVGAWAIQLASCWALMFALGLDHRAGLAASAAVLFAVNVTAVVPATPSNIGIFQLAVISVLHTGFGVSTPDALAYGVILQAVEIATAVGLGLPALFREGLTWSDLRSQALATSSVELDYKPRREKRSRVGDTI
jgi:phosphatidyl-myo-inositol alpha-mannosyltransferase